MSASGHGVNWTNDKVYLDWRPLGEFHIESGRYGGEFKTAKEMCENAARELGLEASRYRCVRSK